VWVRRKIDNSFKVKNCLQTLSRHTSTGTAFTHFEEEKMMATNVGDNFRRLRGGEVEEPKDPSLGLFLEDGMFCRRCGEWMLTLRVSKDSGYAASSGMDLMLFALSTWIKSLSMLLSRSLIIDKRLRVES
jgi:hypothetical protein